MSGEIFVDTEALHNHARSVRSFGAQAGDAVSAADQVAFNPSMFGSIGSKLVGPFMDPLQWAGVQSTKAVQESFTSTADIIDGLATGFKHVDDTIGKKVKAIGKAIR